MKKILVLNSELSGVNRHLFSHLKKKDWELEIVDVPYPKLCRLWALLSSFRINLRDWKQRFNEKLEGLNKTPWTFLQRSRFCQKNIEKLNGKIAIIFQISGMFAPANNLKQLKVPYVTYNDYTMKLAEKEYPFWASFASQKQARSWYALEADLYKNAAGVFTFSNNTRNSVINDYRVDKNKVAAVGAGVNFECIPSLAEKKYVRKVILFIGNDFKRKGGTILLEAFKKVKEEIKDAKLIIVGQNTHKINIPGVCVKGYIKDRNLLQQLYNEASIFVLPSIADPFPNVLFEAMAYKLPCISTNVSGIPEQIENGKTGYIVPANNIDNLAEKITFLLKDPQKMKEMGGNAQKIIQKKFTWDKVSDKIDSNLRQILEDGKPI